MSLHATDRMPSALAVTAGAAVARARLAVAASVGLHALVGVALLTVRAVPAPEIAPSVAVEMVIEAPPAAAEPAQAAMAEAPAPAETDPSEPAPAAPPPPEAAVPPPEPTPPPEAAVPLPEPTPLPEAAVPPPEPAPPPPEAAVPPPEPTPPPEAAAPPPEAATPPPEAAMPRPETPRVPPRPRAPRLAARPAQAATDAAPPAARTAAAPPAPEPARVSPTWNASIAAWLHRHKTYPTAARSRGEQGSAAVRFTVERDGSVTEVALTRGSGSPILDEAVRSLLMGAHVPAFPPDMPQPRVTVTVQITYTLDR